MVKDIKEQKDAKIKSKAETLGKKEQINKESMLSYDEEDVSESEDDVSDPVMAAKWKLKVTCETLNPPVKEDQILGKWYAIIYSSKHPGCSWVKFCTDSMMMKIAQKSPWK